MHGLHDRMPFRRGLRKTHRGNTRPDRTKDRTLPGRKTPSTIYVRNFYPARSFAAHALAAARVSEIRTARRRAWFALAEVVAEESAGDGSAASEACTA